MKNILINRQKEIAFFEDIFSDINISHKSKVVFVFGEAGIGKTALIDTIINNAQEKNFLTLKGKCTYEYADSYLPIINALCNYFGIKKDSKIENIKNILKNSAPELLSCIPVIGSYLVASHKITESAINELTKNSQMDSIDKDEPQRQIFRYTTQIFNNLLKKNPVLIFIDDIQWSDIGTINILKHLLITNLNSPLLIIIAYRIEEIDSKIEDILLGLKSSISTERETKWHEIEVKAFEEIDSNMLIEKILESSQLPNSLFQLIYEKTEGHPFFITQIINDLVESKKIIYDRGIWTLNSSIENIEVPKNVKELIKRRIIRLDKKNRKLLENATIEGHYFHSDVLAHISDINFGEVLNLLSDLEREHHLVSDKTTFFEFQHGMIHNTVYKEIPNQLKEYLHEKTGDFLEKNRNHMEVAEKLAYNYSRSKNIEKAIRYNFLAGKKSSYFGSNDDSLKYFENALNLINKLGSKKEVEKSKLKILPLYIKAKYLQGDLEYSIALGLEVITLNEKLNEPEMKMGDIHNTLGVLYRTKGDFDLAQKHFELAIRLGDNFIKSKAYGNLGIVYWRKGEFNKAIAFPQTSLSLSEELGEESSLPKWSWTWAWDHLFLGKIYLEKENFETSEYHMQTAYKLFENINNKQGLINSYENLGYLSICTKKFDLSLNYLDMSMKLNNEFGIIMNFANCNNYFGQAHIELKNYDKAYEFLNQAAIFDKLLGKKIFILQDYIFIGKLYLLNGKRTLSLKSYQSALNYSMELNNNEISNLLEKIIYFLEKEISIDEIIENQNRVEYILKFIRY